MRKLTLKKETLVELSAEEMTNVVGGYDGPTKPQCVSGIVACVTYRCVESLGTCASVAGC